MVIEEVIAFLKKVPPFQFLDDEAIKTIASGVSIEFYPKDTLILKQDGVPSEYLRIIKKGSVKVFVRTKDNEEVLIDYRGEGDSFGFLSLVSGDRSRANVVAAEDTICYLVDKESVLRLLEKNPSLTEFFLKSFLNKYIDRTYKEMRSRSLLIGGGDKLLFVTPVKEIISRPPITAPSDISIKEAAQIMSKNRISSLVLLDGDAPVGIITDRDLRDKVVAKGKDINEPVSSIMSVSLIKVDANEYCFEALLKMVRFNIHHLLVVEDGTLRGIVTNHDLMLLQGTSPISIAREIEIQQSIEGLETVSRKINQIIGLLLRDGAKATSITRIITELNDRLVKKILEIAERRFGRPPLPYCWIVFGSEGRREQTFKTDQDNAIIYVDPETQEEEKKAREYFTVFTDFVKNGLLKCGYSPCPAGYMASSPQWCQPLKTWKRYFSSWTSEPVAESVLKSLILFDFRGLYGDMNLADELRNYLGTLLEGNKVFLGYMANAIIKNRPPIGFLKSFVVEKTGEHKDELNLKVKGIAPIVDIVRLFSLEKNIKETSTVERINILKDKHTIVKDYADELLHAFEFMMLLRIHHQFEQIESGNNPDNFINPNRLSNLEKRTLKEAFHLISKLQDTIIERYKALIW
jgi:CBS domain-containing protein